MENIFNQHLIQQQQSGSDFQSLDHPQSPSSSLSDSGTTTYSISDEEHVILACNRPKKNAGRKKFKETRHPIYRGVRSRDNNKWVCEVRDPNIKSKRIWLGTYNTPEMAARAHDVAALALRGASVCLNFADSIWRLPVPESADAKDIRKAATMAAEMFAESAEKFSQLSLKERVPHSVCSITSSSNKTENVFYVDEEAEFGMEDIFANMEEGLLLYPHPCEGSHYYYNTNLGDDENDSEVSLWDFSL